MPIVGSGRKGHRRSARKRSGTCGSAADARRTANDRAICAPRHTYRQIKSCAALWTSFTGWSIHRNCRRIAYHLISTVLQGGENIRDPAVGVRGDDSRARYANHLRIVRLPGYLVGDVNVRRRMDITAVCFEVKEERGSTAAKVPLAGWIVIPSNFRSRAQLFRLSSQMPTPARAKMLIHLPTDLRFMKTPERAGSAHTRAAREGPI